MLSRWGIVVARPSPEYRWCSDSNVSHTFSFVAGLDPATMDFGRRLASFRGYPAQGRAWTKWGYSECTT
jgi:hypothetical protein